MAPGKEKRDSFQLVSSELRNAVWDILDKWFKETKTDFAQENLQSLLEPDARINEMPTLVGGISKIIEDPIFLTDLDPGGALYSSARNFGRVYYESGFKIEKLMADLNLLRRKLWLFCDRIEAGRPADDFYELERRLNLGCELITSAAVDAFHGRATETLTDSSTRDVLTGLLRPQVFRERLLSELAKSKRYRRPLVIIRTDIDNFASFNQKQGRLMGNRLLQRVADELQDEIRSTDEKARLGPDEFGILLPETGAVGAWVAAERVRRRIRRIKREDNLPVTVSVGGAVFPDQAEAHEILMNEANMSLKQAQKSGGDLVRF